MKGILNLYKESGVSSAVMISKARRILGIKQIGHFGTLDPQGTGVLLSGVGKATRLFDYYLTKDKIYEADFCFGYTTDTLDPEGTVTARTAAPSGAPLISAALKRFTGELMQIPPQYSAKSVNGVRAYELARKGEEVSLKAVPVTVYSFELLRRSGENQYRFRIHCSSGTYIRSLCRDLAESLGSLACMTSIHRVSAGNFTDRTAVRLEELESLKEKAVIPLESALSHLPRRDFPDSLYQKILDGIKIDTESSDGFFTVYCKHELFGLGKESDRKLKIVTFLKD